MIARITFTISLLTILFAVVPSHAASLAEMSHYDQMLALRAAYQQNFGAEKSIFGGENALAGDGMRKCGLPLALEIRALQAEHGTIAGFSEVMDRPTNLPLEFDSPGGHFKIHYTTTPGSRDTIDTRYGDQNSNSVPDYVEIVARIADSCWVHHIDQLGYVEPINDAAHGGGDARYDIFVKDVGSQVYGSTVPDVGIDDNGTFRFTTWMEVDTRYQDYFNYSNRPIEALQVTVAHEFFHAIHLTYDGLETCTTPACPLSAQNPYWLEMSAVWMEEETYDDVNDYYSYLQFYLPTIHNAPYYISNDGLNIYGAGVFPIFLAEKYGRDIIRRAWEYCGATPRENFFVNAIQNALFDQTGGEVNLEEAWTEFTRWLFFTGGRARTGRYFSEAANYDMVPDVIGNPPRNYIRYYSEYPITSQQSADNQFQPSELGINYTVFRTGSLDSGFVMDFVGVASTNPTTEWRKSVIAYDRFNANGLFRVHENLYPLNTQVREDDLDGVTDVVVIPTIINPELRRLGNSYRFSVADSSVVIEEDLVSFANTKFNVANARELPFKVIFDVHAPANVDISIFTVAGERVYQSEVKAITPGDPYSFIWEGQNDDAEDVASGVYIVQARIGADVRHQKIFVVR